ncbi:MAG: mannose-1-phosphate guanylyltransferase, partial [Crocosphaera sp.]
VQIQAELPRICHKSYVLRCPWKIKGALMRYLVEIHNTEQLELIDGVKIINPQNDNWVLILPDAGEPLVHIIANSDDREWVDINLREYRHKVQTFIEREQGDLTGM